MMATVLHVTSGLGLRKFQADGFLLTRVYMIVRKSFKYEACKADTLTRTLEGVHNVAV